MRGWKNKRWCSRWAAMGSGAPDQGDKSEPLFITCCCFLFQNERVLVKSEKKKKKAWGSSSNKVKQILREKYGRVGTVGLDPVPEPF